MAAAGCEEDDAAESGREFDLLHDLEMIGVCYYYCFASPIS